MPRSPTATIPAPSSTTASAESPPKRGSDSRQTIEASGIKRGFDGPGASAPDQTQDRTQTSSNQRHSHRAFSTAAHCGGRSARRQGRAGRRLRARSDRVAPAPRSPTRPRRRNRPRPAAAPAGRSPRAPFGQFSRTWKWSLCPHHGRILRSQARSLGGVAAHIASLAGGVMKMRSTAGSRAAARNSAACDGVQLPFTCFWSAERTLFADRPSRCARVRLRLGGRQQPDVDVEPGLMRGMPPDRPAARLADIADIEAPPADPRRVDAQPLDEGDGGGMAPERGCATAASPARSGRSRATAPRRRGSPWSSGRSE